MNKLNNHAKLDDDALIWRYMDLPQFISLLQKKGLYFNRVDNFEDKYEGTIPTFKPSKRPGMEHLHLSPNLQLFQEYMLKSNQITYVNCWHINDTESAGMWKIYQKCGIGIAIKSTYFNIVRCFVGDKQPSMVGKIEYIDYENADIDSVGNFYPHLYKRKNFAHENELRAVYTDENHPFIKDKSADVTNSIMGLVFNVNLNILVKEIFVSPETPHWVIEIIEELKNNYSVEANIVRSKI